MAYCPPAGAPVPEQGDHAPLPRFASLQHRSSMADLLDRVVKSLLRSPSVGQVRLARLHTAPRGILVAICRSRPCKRLLIYRVFEGKLQNRVSQDASP